jgi:DeoR/GlpR family transcriptional regulator of sugar metabolism
MDTTAGRGTSSSPGSPPSPALATRRGRASAEERAARLAAIAEYVNEYGAKSVEDLAAYVDVSPMTAYRDVAELERQGLLRRYKGLVTAAATQLHEASSAYRLRRNRTEKQILAKAAAEFIEPGSSLMMDDSTTGLPLAELLGERGPLTLITNYQPVARAVEGKEGIRLILTGGEYHAWADAFMGSMAVAAIQSLRADAVVMSASAIIDTQCFHPAEEPAEIKRAMLAASSLKILYVDHTKFTRTALHLVAPVSDFDLVIVDAATQHSDVEALEGAGTKVVRAA